MEHPLVSVIMPAYNCASTVAESVRSVQAQTVGDWELLIIEDGSADNTLEILQQLCGEDSRIRLLQNRENLGVAQTRNRGLDAARGRYIAFLDSDDLWLPDKLEKQIAALEQSGADLCYTSYEFIGLDGNAFGRSYAVPETVTYRQLLGENVVGLSTVLLRRSALGPLRFEDGWFHEDYVLWLRLLRQGKRFRGLEERLVRYRTGGRSANKLTAARHRWRIYRKSEGLSLLTAGASLIQYAVSGMKKHR